MAQTVTFTKLPRNAVLNDEDYEWLSERMGVALPLFQLTFDAEGAVTTLAVHANGSCISVFMSPGIEFDVSLPPSIRRLASGTHKVLCECELCGAKAVLQVSASGIRNYAAGHGSQYAFPELNEDERRLLIAKTCPSCWRRLVADGRRKL